jgi:hypothetical protein
LVICRVISYTSNSQASTGRKGKGKGREKGKGRKPSLSNLALFESMIWLMYMATLQEQNPLEECHLNLGAKMQDLSSGIRQTTREKMWNVVHA